MTSSSAEKVRRWPLRSKAVALSIFGLSCAIAYWLGRNYTGALTSPTERLIVPEDKLNIGEVWESPEFHWTLPLQNKSSDPIEIVAFHSSCSCLSIQPSQMFIGPRQAIDLPLTID